ncbi:MAG TPA: DUF4382 domain-containing protein [Candidatus Angelobacter sp.]|nr:DUF4382 domain-containing protein [Candidatus Angelobacter sp.]
MSKGPVAVILAIIIIGAIAGYVFYTSYVPGTLTLTITDPAQAPPGNSQQYDPSITHIYVSVSGFQVHVAGQGDASGWNPMPISTQTIDMLSVLNVSKVLGTMKFSAGKYDILRFNVTAVTVDFVSTASASYTVPSGSLKVSVTNGGFQITATSSVTVLLTLSFNNQEILAMNTHLTPVAKAAVV